MFCQKGKFSLFEQIWMQLSFNCIWILGAIAIFIENPILSVGYIIIFPLFGILFCVMHLWICPRCPHIKIHSACTQLPPFLTKRIIQKNIDYSLNNFEKIGFFIVLYGIAIIPMYWIIKTKYLIIPYLFFILMHYLAYYLHFCKKCLNIHCPQSIKK